MDVGLVCDQCDMLNAIASSTCVACNAPVSLDAQEAPREPTAPSSLRNTAPYGVIQTALAKLVLIRGRSLDGVSYVLVGQEHVMGRTEGALLFRDDPYLSPRHACFFYRNGALFVRDEGSANGTYLRLREPTALALGACFIVGEQVLRVETPPPEPVLPAPQVDGTYPMVTQRRSSRLRIVQLLQGGTAGLSHHAIGTQVTIGRDGCDVSFPNDKFISNKHAKISMQSGDGVPEQIVLADLGSRNGTFLRIEGETALCHGDCLFIGQEIFRVEVAA